jgi:hypothetical protein
MKGDPMRKYVHWQMILPFSVLAVSLLIPVAGSAGMDIASLSEKIEMDATGAAKVKIAARLAKAEPGTLLIPTSFKAVEGLKIDGLAGASVALTEKDGVRSFAITTPVAPSEKEPVMVSFSVPGFYDWKKEKVADFGNRGLEYRFLNTLPTRVQSYSMQLMLPPGYVVNTVEDSLPKLTSKSPSPPYQIVRSGDQYGISIKSSKLGVGDYCMVRIRFKDGSKSTAFLMSGLLLAGVYLIAFRGTARTPTEAKPLGRNDH